MPSVRRTQAVAQAHRTPVRYTEVPHCHWVSCRVPLLGNGPIEMPDALPRRQAAEQIRVPEPFQVDENLRGVNESAEFQPPNRPRIPQPSQLPTTKDLGRRRHSPTQTSDEPHFRCTLRLVGVPSPAELIDEFLRS